jgi:hypothetical protein
MMKVIVAPPNLDVASYSSIADPTRRKCEELGFQTIYDIPLEQQLQVREELLDEHYLWLKSCPGESTITFSVFSWLADWMRWAWNVVPANKWCSIIEKARRCADLYGAIEFISEGPELRYDGYAWLDKANAEQIQSLSRYTVTLLGQDAKVVS